MKRLVLAVALLSGACTRPDRSHPGDEVSPPAELLTTDRLVPVLCAETVEVSPVDSDAMTTEMSLEEKTFRLLRSDAQHRINTNKLETAAVRCGVKVVK